jgi:hypothetical protein
MKFSLLFLSLTLSLSAFTQTFKLQESSSRANYDICQENHNRILNKFIAQTDSQIERMLNGLQIEFHENAPDFKINYYKEVLNELIVKRIFFAELSKQLNSQKMSQPGNPEYPSKLKFLNPDAIKIDLGSQYQKTLEQIVNAKNIKIGTDFLKEIRNDLIKETVKSMVSSRFRQIGAGIFARVVMNQTGRIATGQIVKTATLHFGSEIFVSVGTGLLLNLLTFPLHAYRLPPETEWTDLLKEHPETIIVPEWMTKAGLQDPPWMAHCNAIQRRTRYMEEALSKAIKSDEAEFKASIRDIYQMSNHAQKEPEILPSSYTVPSDNTRVYRAPVYNKSPGPLWLAKH